MQYNEKPQKSNYNLREKFLQILPEQRINGKQFFIRMIILGLGVSILIILLSMLISSIALSFGIKQGILTIGISIFMLITPSILLFFLSPSLIAKRVNDFQSQYSIKCVMYYKIFLIIITLVKLFILFFPGYIYNMTFPFALLFGIFILYLTFKRGDQGNTEMNI